VFGGAAVTSVVGDPVGRPSPSRRFAAVGAIVIVVGVLAATLVLALQDPGHRIAAVALVAVFAVAVWYALTRSGRARVLAAALAVAAVAGVAAVLVVGSLSSVLVRVGLLVVAVGLGRYAAARDVQTLKQSVTPGIPVPPARRGVLIMNLKSGGGKAERFSLVDECRKRGIEPVVLQPGDDLAALARDAIARGADVVGMAGGDGSQASVAEVAADHDVPFVVVPAGTRNHLALDLGIDRDDVVGALDAFAGAVEQPMDLAMVNGRVFVNNVSLGLYAAVVRSPEYRDAKVDTTLAALPTVLGPGTRPFDLRFDGPDRVHHDGAHMVLVSNGPYGHSVRTMASRASVRDGVLGVTALVVPDDAAARRFLRSLALDRPERYAGFHAWETTTFVVDSGAQVPVGVDGETVTLEPPLRFSVRRAAVRVRLAPSAIGYSPTARSVAVGQYLSAMWRVARGCTVAIDD
jgi:diacylglycerol kinase family enzyme